jgi:hypothetical protein
MRHSRQGSLKKANIVSFDIGWVSSYPWRGSPASDTNAPTEELMTSDRAQQLDMKNEMSGRCFRRCKYRPTSPSCPTYVERDSQCCGSSATALHQACFPLTRIIYRCANRIFLPQYPSRPVSQVQGHTTPHHHP